MTTATAGSGDGAAATGSPAATGGGTGAPAGGAAATGDGKGSAGSGGASGAGSTAGDGGKGYWPDNWREQVAGDDEKVKERLGRYASPGEVAKALIAAQNKISAGELRPSLGKNASAEEVAEYRKALGIPEAPDKYDLDLGGGLVVADDDRPLVQKFLDAAHRTNQTPDQVRAGLRAYYEITEAAEAQRSALDEQTRVSAEEALRTEWGAEYRANVNRITQLLDGVMGPEAKAEFLNARQADGTPVFNNPEILKALANLALIQNPSGAVLPAGGTQSGIEDRIAQIEKIMGTKAYLSNEKVQKEYRDLVEAREKLAPKKAA